MDFFPGRETVVAVPRGEAIVMCELLGLCFNKEVSVHLAFSGLKAGATDNPDGWGVGWYDEYGIQVIKEAKPVDRSLLARSFLKDLGARSRIFVSHIRRATAGAAGYLNTHPFCRRFDYKTWVFAHNGTIDSDQLGLASGEFIPTGETDSELVFCTLLSGLKRHGIHLDDRNDFTILHEKLREINDFGELNLIFSDGRYLFAYHDRSGYVGLHFLLRQAPYEVVKLRGQFLTVNLAEIVDPDERGYLVASKPLSNENWTGVKPGQLLVFFAGNLIFMSEDG
ncbi:MAG: class II glutamine amidotransferase [Syntrophobacteria bacterium]